VQKHVLKRSHFLGNGCVEQVAITVAVAGIPNPQQAGIVMTFHVKLVRHVANFT
jgi:hypothetical protein